MTLRPNTIAANTVKPNRKWLLIGALILVAFSIYLLAFLLPDTIRAMAGPSDLDLDAAPAVVSGESMYVTLTGGAWDCDSFNEVRGVSLTLLKYGRLREETRYTEAFFVSNSRDTAAYVTLSGAVDCDDVTDTQPTGYLYAMDEELQQALTNNAQLARFLFTDTFVEMCGYCGYENSLIGVIFGFIFLLSGLGLLFLYFRTGKTAASGLAG
ncbi:MAG: hypothetical protein IPM16_07010 [Chloroflexi bacterium]|nr:hypothetical protein [Chloroflexota bacterium]